MDEQSNRITEISISCEKTIGILVGKLREQRQLSSQTSIKLLLNDDPTPLDYYRKLSDIWTDIVSEQDKVIQVTMHVNEKGVPVGEPCY